MMDNSDKPFITFLPFTPPPDASGSSSSISSDESTSVNFNTFSLSSSAHSSSSSSSSSPDYSGSGSGSSDGLCFDWITIRGIAIMDPVLIPLCLWALYIGISRFIKFRKHSNTYFYSITYLTYGIMMTFAMLSDSLSVNKYVANTFWSIAFNFIDVDLTSTVATFFFYSGLADIGKLDMKKIGGRLLVCGSSLLIASLWFYSYAVTRNDSIWPRILYQGVVGFCCGFYCLFQLYYLSKIRKSFKPIVWLMIAGVTGFIGLVITFNSKLWCHYFGSHFNPSYTWFFLSDITMLFMSHYIKKSRAQSVNQLISYYEDDEDDDQNESTKSLLSINDIDGGSSNDDRFIIKYNTFKEDNNDNLKNNNNNNNNNYRYMNRQESPQPYVSVSHQPQLPLPPLGYVFVSNQHPNTQYFIPTLNNNNNINNTNNNNNVYYL